MPTNNNKDNTQNPFAAFFTPLKGAGFSSALYSKNLEVLKGLNTLMTDYCQAVAKRQQQILQEQMEEYSRAMREAFSHTTPMDRTEKNMALAKKTFEKSVANMSEMAEMFNTSHRQAVELFNRRTAEVVEETKATLKNFPKI